jgi:cell division transport system permease protein
MNKIKYHLKQALNQISRNKGMSLASVFAITAMMLILGLFLVISVNINLFTKSIKEDYDTVELYLEDGLTKNEVQEVTKQVEDIGGVSSVKYRSKAEAMKVMKKRWGKNGYLLDSLGENPLPASLLVEVTDLESADNVNAEAKKIKGVESVRYYKQTVDRLAKVIHYIQVASILIMIFLFIISIVVVSNTIKLTVFARSREISIMKYIGATNWFIRGPFLLEGILIGVVAALVSAIFTFLAYARIVSSIGPKVAAILSTPMISAPKIALTLFVVFLAIGVGIGALGSIISIRRFLKV